MSLAKCAGCDMPILDQYLYNVLDRPWHQSCIQCNDCKMSLNDKCFSREGKIFCKDDFIRRFGPKCSGCQLGISPTDLVRKARDRVFHINCFICCMCYKQITTGEQLYVVDENKFMCKQDYIMNKKFQEEFEDDQGCIKSPMNCSNSHSNIYDSSSSASSTSSINCGDLVGNHNTSPLLQNRSYNILNSPSINSTIQSNHSAHNSSRRLNSISTDNTPVGSSGSLTLNDASPNPPILVNHIGKNSSKCSLNLKSTLSQNNSLGTMPVLDNPEKENLLVNTSIETSLSSLGSANLSANNELLYENSNVKEEVSNTSSNSSCSNNSCNNPNYNSSGNLNQNNSIQNNNPQQHIIEFMDDLSEKEDNSDDDDQLDDDDEVDDEDEDDDDDDEDDENCDGNGNSLRRNKHSNSSKLDDINNLNGKKRGPRTTIKAKQLEMLKSAFAATPKPTRHIREQLAQETGLNMRVIQVWFQNRRSKERRMKQLSAMGNRRQYYRNSNASRNIPQHQQQTLNDQINLSGTLISQQTQPGIGINLTPSLVNRQLSTQPIQSQILSNSNIHTHNNSQLSIGIAQSSLGQHNNPNSSYEIQNENNELMNSHIINNSSVIGNNPPNNYINNPGNKLPINYNINNYFN